MNTDENTSSNQQQQQQYGFADAADVLATSAMKTGGRKSLGRRVSFAATAKVRLFESGPQVGVGSESTANGDNVDCDDDDNMGDGGDAMEIDSVPVSPLRIAPGTPSSKLPQVFSPTPEAQLPSRIPVRSPLCKPVIASPSKNKSPASSFEIELDQSKTENSMSSYEEHDGGQDNIMRIDDGNNQNNSTVNTANMDDTMDFTTCVGGIAPSAAFQRLSEANTMDFTGCVGKILSDLTATDATINNGKSGVSKYDELENDTMDLTSCIGGLLDTVKTGPSGDTMDMTRVLKSSIVTSTTTTPHSPVHPAVAALKLASPSPFLVHSPLHHHNHQSTSNKRRLSADDVEYIDKVDRPDIMNGLPGSPMVIDAGEVRVGRVESPAVPLRREAVVDDLFQSLIETDPVRQVAGAGIAGSVGADTSSSTHNNNGSTGDQDQTAVCKEILAKAGIRFMDNLTSLGRRETTGRPRESDVITPARHYYLQYGMAPEAAAVDERCREIVDFISGCRQDISRLEGQFITYNSSGQVVLDEEGVSRMKTAKSVARLGARQQWYEWRVAKESMLNRHLSANLHSLRHDLAAFSGKESDIDAIGVPLVRLRDNLQSQCHQIAARELAKASVDWESVGQLQAQCQELEQLSSQLDLDMTTLARQEEELRSKLARVQEEKRAAQKQVDQLEAARQEQCECNELALRELKSRMALLQAVHGWHLVSVKADHLIIQWQRHDSVHVQAKIQLEVGISSAYDGSSISGSSGTTHTNNAQAHTVTVPSIQLLANGTGHSIVKHAASIVKLEAGRPLLKTILSLLSQLDRLHHMHRTITRTLSPRVTVDPSEPVLTVSFFTGKSKWAVRVGVRADRLELVGVESCEYGSGGGIGEEAVREAIDAANLGNRHCQLDTLVDRLSSLVTTD
jgi:hypothetical protein